MKLLKFLISFIVLSFSLCTSVSAKNIKSKDILPYLESIQVVALKEKKDIYKENSRLYGHNTFIELGQDFNKLHIINIKKKEFLSLLKQVKKEYPDAYRSTKKIRKLRKNYHQVSYLPKEKLIYSSTILNRDSILKTRRKFF